jgi:peptidoglycan/xylan/chitin deacetylase (PgdA/CDA1 family)
VDTGSTVVTRMLNCLPLLFGSLGSKREKASAVAARLGLAWMLERLPRRPCLLVFNYHRIAEQGNNPYDPGLIEASPDQFDEQMRILKKHYALAELAEVQELVDHPERIRHCRVLVTLDDGYRDNHDVAFPILRSHGIKATFFLATGFVGTNRVPWWDQLAYLVRRTEKRTLRLHYPRELTCDIHERSRFAVLETLLSLYKCEKTPDPERFLCGVAEACGVTRPREASERLFMTWEDARSLVKGGMSIGSHSHDHELLAKLSREEQLHQCRLSREIIAREVGLEVDAMAYPVGSRSSFSDVTLGCLRETGYRTAFSYYGGVNASSKAIPRYDVNRISVGGGASSRFRMRTAVAVVTARDLW